MCPAFLIESFFPAFLATGPPRTGKAPERRASQKTCRRDYTDFASTVNGAGLGSFSTERIECVENNLGCRTARALLRVRRSVPFHLCGPPERNSVQPKTDKR